MNLLPVLLSLIGFLITIGIVVIIHEGGHYLAAKRLGFAVKRFSIGMGRVLWRRRAWDTEFAVSLLPFGGYVAFEDDGDESEPERPRARGIRFEEGPRWRKAVVVAAGPLMNFVLAVVLFSAAGALGVRDIAPHVAPVADTQAAAAGVGDMDLVISVDGRRVVGVMDFNGALLERLGDRDVAVEFRSDRTGATYERHFDLSHVSLEDASKSGGLVLGSVGLRPAARGLELHEVAPGGAAARAGLLAGDVILEVNGERAEMRAFATAIRTGAGKTVRLLVKRGGADAAPTAVELRPEASQDKETGKEIGLAGVRFGSHLEFVTVRLNPVESVRVAFDKVVGLTRFQAEAVGGMARGEVSAENLSGPVGIADMAGSAITAGLATFLEFVALISIAVGFMNLIPIPALDGGQLVILALEGLLGRSFSRDVKEKLSMASMALLVLLAVYVTVNDIGRLTG